MRTTDKQKSLEKRFLDLLGRLGSAERDTLLAFAEFLLSRQVPSPRLAEVVNPLPRPARETVVGAIKRLAASYPMLDKRKVLHEASDLMAQHVMQGRPAPQVIDDLEVCFRRHYERYLEQPGDAP